MSEFTELRSFTPLATISLSQQHVLHPEACNPTMDLVALIVEDSGDSAPGFGGKGKARAGPVLTTVELWRLSGSKVWDAKVAGRVLGLAWSRDGLFLSLLVLQLEPWPGHELSGVNKSVVQHLSVHTGKVTRTVPVPPKVIKHVSRADWASAADRLSRPEWWPMEWADGGTEWAKPLPGSSLMIIDSLPGVTPVDPPKPAIINPFAPPPPTAKDLGPHKKVETFPSLLPSNPRAPPDVLTLLPPARGMSREGGRLLTGTFRLPEGTPSPTPPSVLALAERSDRLASLINVLFRGIESIEAALRDGDKQTMIWREELETCGQQQGMSEADVHADLFRYLMAGRCGPAVNEWLGNRMTNRTVSKWESGLQTAFSTLQSIVSLSIVPALERIILILEELRTWAGETSESDLNIDGEAVQRAIDVAKAFALLSEHLRQEAELEEAASEEWCKWLRFEMSRITASADDALPVPTHDVKLVWSFMKNSFMHPRLAVNFPRDPDAANDVLPPNVPPKAPPVSSALDAVLRQTLSRLGATPAPEGLASPPPFGDHSLDSISASPLPVSPGPVPSSPDTAGGGAEMREERPIERHPEVEPLTWANTLLSVCSDIVNSVTPKYPQQSKTDDTLLAAIPPETFLSERTIEGVRWLVFMQSSSTLDLVASSSADGTLRGARLYVPEGEIVQAGFFDDEELAVVFQLGGERYLATTAVEALREQLVDVSMSSEADLGALYQDLSPQEMVVARCRAIGTARSGPDSWLLALNGRKGRRSCCVLTKGGTEVEVLDMDLNEDDEEEEADEVENDVDME